MIKPYLITYDLCKPGRNYDGLITMLATTWKAKKLADSVWLAELQGDTGKVIQCLRQVTDPTDRLAVLEIKPGSDWCTLNAYPGGVQWLSQHVTALKAA